MNKEPGERVILGGAVVAALAASLCCILPVIAVVFGLGAFGIAAVFESLRPYMLVVVFAALAYSFYRIYLRREECGEGAACSTKPIGRINQLVFWAVAAMVAVLAAFPYYSGSIVAAIDTSNPTHQEEVSLAADSAPSYQAEESDDSPPAVAEPESQNRQTVVIAVEGMTCEGCAAQLNVALKRLKGVISAEANYPQKNVKVVYNPKLVTVERIKKAIYDAGYTPK